MRQTNPVEKVPFKVYLSKRTADRMLVAFGNVETGDLKFGTLTKLADIAIQSFLKRSSDSLIAKEIELMEVGSTEWWNEQRRRAAADLMTEAELADCIDRLREGRKTMTGEKKSKSKKATEVTPLDINELEAML